jgi:neutral amino acid transport system ATP-binding protein
MPMLEVKNVCRHFDGIKAVDNCTFAVEAGTITALIGPNGAGKTTAFNVITGLLKPTSGEIYFKGQPIGGLAPHKITRRGISRTFQITRILSEMTLLENLAVASPTKSIRDLWLAGILPGEAERAVELLQFLGIERLAHETAGSLSYGQRKLLELGCVLMADPDLLMLDEPAGGVNPSLLETIMDRIVELNRRGKTVLLVEHNMDLVMNISHSVICMAYGTVLAAGTAAEIQNNPDVLEAYLGV